MIERRHTNRRDFLHDDVPPDVIYELTNAAEQEEAHVVQLVSPQHKIIAARLSEEAEATQKADPRYLEELRAWTTTDLRRRDGISITAIPRTDEGSELSLWFATSTSLERDGYRG
jgi:hypothetical protein